MATNVEYVRIISNIWYGWKMIDIIRPEIKLKQRMTSESRVLSRT